MLNAVVVSIRFSLLLLCGQKQVALENAALRHQLAVVGIVRVPGDQNASRQLFKILASVYEIIFSQLR